MVINERIQWMKLVPKYKVSISEDCHIAEHWLNPIDCMNVFSVEKMLFKQEDSMLNDC